METTENIVKSSKTTPGAEVSADTVANFGKDNSPLPPLFNSQQNLASKLTLGSFYKMKIKSNGVTSEKFFRFEGDIEAARKRAQEHCRVQGFHHIWTERVVADIDNEDDRKMRGN